MVFFVAASALVNRTLFAADLAGYGYGYSYGGYAYADIVGYAGYSDAMPSAPGEFSCDGTASEQITCIWAPVTTTMAGTALDFGYYKVFRSSTDPASLSDTLVATVSTQSSGLAASATGLTAGETYYFAAYAYDDNENYSLASTASAAPGTGETGGGVVGGGTASPSTLAQDDPPEPDAPATPSGDAARDAQLAELGTEASTVADAGSAGLAELVGEERSLDTERGALDILARARLSVTEGTIAFTAYGTPSTTHLGAGERAGVLSSYIGAFGDFPETADEWLDLLKIANGRWPSQMSEEAEAHALEQFEAVYLRAPDRDNPNDDAAVMIMAYGLRPGPGDRNLDSERAAITIYRGIFGTDASTAREWDTVRAIAYSGASR